MMSTTTAVKIIYEHCIQTDGVEIGMKRFLVRLALWCCVVAIDMERFILSMVL